MVLHTLRYWATALTVPINPSTLSQHTSVLSTPTPPCAEWPDYGLTSTAAGC